jgi:hypothetical protein
MFLICSSIPLALKWNPACDISETNDGIIDELDLGVFAAHWLAGAGP